MSPQASILRYSFSTMVITTGATTSSKSSGAKPKSLLGQFFTAFFSAPLASIISSNNQNHRGAMMELGEGLCKLRKIGFESGPFLRFEQEISEALEFVYQTQKELAACADDLCIAMYGSEVSYRLLGSFAAGQKLYKVDHSPEGLPCIIFTSSRHHVLDKPSMVKVPTLDASKEHLEAFQYRSK